MTNSRLPSPLRVATRYAGTTRLNQEFTVGDNRILYQSVGIFTGYMLIKGQADSMVGFVPFEAEVGIYDPNDELAQDVMGSKLSSRFILRSVFPGMKLVPGDDRKLREEVRDLIFRTIDKLKLPSMEKSLTPDEILAKSGLGKTRFVILSGTPKKEISYRDWSRNNPGYGFGSFQFSQKFASCTPPADNPKVALAKAKIDASDYEKSQWPGGMTEIAGLVYWSDHDKWSGVWSRYYSPS